MSGGVARMKRAWARFNSALRANATKRPGATLDDAIQYTRQLATRLDAWDAIVMENVRDHQNGFPVDLWTMDVGTERRVMVSASNPDGQGSTNGVAWIDVVDLLEWLKRECAGR